MRTLLAGVAIVAAVMSVSAAAGGAGPRPEPGRFMYAVATQPLSLAVQGSQHKVIQGQETTYVITAVNEGREPAAVTIRASLPLRMSAVTPHDGGLLGERVVDWPVTLAPGVPTSVRMAGVYAAPEAAGVGGGSDRVAFTACALDPEQNRPLVCATSVAQLTAPADLRWWLGAAALAAAAAIGLIAMLVRRWRGRRRRARLAASVPTDPKPPLVKR